MSLKGFSGEIIQPIGVIALLVFEGTGPCIATTMTDKAQSSYDAIIGCSTLNNLNVVTSTHHLKMKFLMEVGVWKYEVNRCWHGNVVY